MISRILLSFLTCFFISSLAANPSTAVFPGSTPTSDKAAANDGDSEGAKVSGAPVFSADEEAILVPKVEASYEDVWRHWTPVGDAETKVWKHRFAATMALNGDLQADDNKELVQDFLQRGGNIDVDITLGASAFGQTHDGLTVYLKAAYSKLDTKEYIAVDQTQDLSEEVGKLGAGLGVKFEQDFYAGFETLQAHVLGSEENIGPFHEAVDDKWLRTALFVWKFKASETDSNNYIRLFRTWGAEKVDAKIGIQFSKKFDLDL